MPGLVYYTEAGIPTQLSASALARTGRGVLLGIFVSSANASSKIAFTDGTVSGASAAAGRFVSPFVASVGYKQLRMIFANGLYVSLSGSAQQVTVIVEPS